LEWRVPKQDGRILLKWDQFITEEQVKEEWGLENDPLKGSLGLLRTRSLSGVSFVVPGHRPCWGRRWGSGTGVDLLSHVSPPGAELEESSKNTKKLDAMTLIKEGESQHA
jgi:hypothetical protein